MNKTMCILAAVALVFCSRTFAQAQSVTPERYVEMCTEHSTEISAQREAIEIAETFLEEQQISEASDIELAAARLDVRVAQVRLQELIAGLVPNALSDYASLDMASRSLSRARTALAISVEKEAAAKNQAEEGVKNQLDYLSEYISYRNAEVVVAAAEHGYQNAMRKFLRRLPDTAAGIVPVQIIPPGELPYSIDQMIAMATKSSSSYVRAAGTAEIQARRLTIFAELESTAKTLRDLKAADRNAQRGLTQQDYALEDQTWGLAQAYIILQERWSIGEEQLKLAELRLEESKRGFDFGVVTERQLREVELAYEKEGDARHRRLYDMVIQYMRIIAFTGGDPAAEMGTYVR